MSIIKEVEGRLSIFDNLYDIIRIVDPIGKKLLFNSEQEYQSRRDSCYCLWNKSNFCKNCISMRAYLEDDTFVKLEYIKERFFLVTSTPIIIEENRYIVEIIKDISNKRFVKDDNINNLGDAEILISQMNDKIIIDKLTGIYNRRYIDERLPVDINASVINGQPLSVIMADIDFFKEVNNNHGYIVGDKIIRDFAKLLKESIRKDIDWVGKYDGEKFLVVFNNCNLDNAYEISEKIRKRIESTELCYDDVIVKITSSFGGYSLSSHRMDSENLISYADKNLCEAKIAGKNRTIVNKQQ